MDADRAGLLGDPHYRLFHSLPLMHHQVGHLIDDDDNVGEPIGLALFVVGAQVAHAGLGEQSVAPLHLIDRPG